MPLLLTCVGNKHRQQSQSRAAAADTGAAMNGHTRRHEPHHLCPAQKLQRQPPSHLPTGACAACHSSQSLIVHVQPASCLGNGHSSYGGRSGLPNFPSKKLLLCAMMGPDGDAGQLAQLKQATHQQERDAGLWRGTAWCSYEAAVEEQQSMQHRIKRCDMQPQ